MKPPLVIGADPGSPAGASLLDFGPAKPEVLYCWSWRYLKGKGGRYVLTTPADSIDLQFMHEIGEHIASITEQIAQRRAVVIALEGLYIAAVKGRTKAERAKQAKKAQSTLVTSFRAGELVGPLRRLGPVHRPPANDWLGHLGLSSGMGKDRLEALCLQEARRRYTWPAGFPRCPTQSEDIAVAESAHMAAHISEKLRG